MLKPSECTRDNFCYECTNIKCVLHGKKESDCPKYSCDMPEIVQYNCEHCPFIDRYIKKVRKEKE